MLWCRLVVESLPSLIRVLGLRRRPPLPLPSRLATDLVELLDNFVLYCPVSQRQDRRIRRLLERIIQQGPSFFHHWSTESRAVLRRLLSQGRRRHCNIENGCGE